MLFWKQPLDSAICMNLKHNHLKQILSIFSEYSFFSHSLYSDPFRLYNNSNCNTRSHGVQRLRQCTCIIMPVEDIWPLLIHVKILTWLQNSGHWTNVYCSRFNKRESLLITIGNTRIQASSVSWKQILSLMYLQPLLSSRIQQSVITARG
jgi:hypothetical protein